jgi:hypothetical protein
LSRMLLAELKPFSGGSFPRAPVAGAAPLRVSHFLERVLWWAPTRPSRSLRECANAPGPGSAPLARRR